MKEKEQELEWTISGEKLHISNPKKEYWPDEGYTKEDVLTYYEQMAPVLLPYFKDRPITVHFFPRGITDFSFYKRDYTSDVIKGCHTKPYKEVSQDKTIQVLFIDRSIGFLELASIGGLELHPWASRYPDYHHPDIAVFDLDTNTETSFGIVLSAALKVREYLSNQGITGFPKTSGGRGLHIYVPLKPVYTFNIVRSWVKGVNEVLASKHPDLITTERKKGKTHYENKVTIDYLQNVVTRSTVAPYSLRAYPKAPVSAPLTWEEVKKGGVLPTDFNIKTIPKRLEKWGDLFSEILSKKHYLPINSK